MNNNKKQVAIITRHAVSNYGSVLQAYALQKSIEKLGFKCQIIDYIRDDESYRNIANTLVKKSSWNKNALTRFIYKSIQSPEYIVMGKAFRQYRKSLLNTTEKLYTSFDQLKKNPPVADIYCTGSDQVWGPVGGEDLDRAYFLGFAPEGKKKISYAASFGKSLISGRNKEISQWLKEYNFISVRENSAVELIKDLGINNSFQVLDPTLLLTKNQWCKLCDKDINKKYVLLYQLHSNKEMDSYAEEFAKKCNMNLIRITPLFHRIIKCGKPVYLPNIGKFLSYIKNADYMITDSFHGTAFAINFNIQFVDVLPGDTKTRNQSILELVGLTDRIVKNYNDFSFINKKIDYTYANKKLEEERLHSLEILKLMLSE